MDEQLRVSDAERERAAAALGDHYVQGRLSTEEHEQRVDAVWAARTRGDVDDLFRDLPGSGHAPARRTAPRPPAARQRCGRGPRGWVPFAVLALVLVTIATPLTAPVTVLLVAVLFVLARRRRRAARRLHSGPRDWTTGLDHGTGQRA